MLDLLIKDAQSSTAPARPPVAAMSGCATGGSSRSATSMNRRRKPSTRRARRRAGLRRPAHALRRAAVLGPDREPVGAARRHHRVRRQLRLHARARRTRPRDYLTRMLARVEGMPLDALRPGWTGTGRRSATGSHRLDGKIAVNAGFLVGHSAIRRVAMGDDAVGEKATARADREDGHAARRGAGRRCARLLDVAVADAQRRRRATRAVAQRVARGAARARGGGPGASGHAARGDHPRLPRRASPTTRSRCSPACRSPPTGR